MGSSRGAAGPLLIVTICWLLSPAAPELSPLVDRRVCQSESEAEQEFRLPEFLPGGDETTLDDVSHYGDCTEGLVRGGPRRHGGTDVRIAVLGGGQAAGHACHEHRLSAATPDCAWPARLAEVLEERHPSLKYRVDNFARGGTTSCSFVPALSHLRAYDAVLLDFAVGDTLGRGGRSPAACLEYLLRTLAHGHRSRSGPEAVLLATTATCRGPSLASAHNLTYDGCLARLDGTAAAYKAMAARFGVPFLDLHKLIWRGQTPDGLDGGSLLEIWGEDHAHPRGGVHVFISWAVGRFFGGLVGQACEGCAPGGARGAGADAAPAEGVEPCESYASEFDAASASPGEPTVVSGDWEWVHDPGQPPGWVSRQEGSALDFPVRFGRAPFLTVAYTLRHRDQGAGDLEVSLPEAHPPGDTAHVAGARDDRPGDPEEEGLLFLEAGARGRGAGRVQGANEPVALGAEEGEAVVRVLHAPPPPGRAGGYVKVTRVLTC